MTDGKGEGMEGGRGGGGGGGSGVLKPVGFVLQDAEHKHTVDQGACGVKVMK